MDSSVFVFNILASIVYRDKARKRRENREIMEQTIAMTME